MKEYENVLIVFIVCLFQATFKLSITDLKVAKNQFSVKKLTLVFLSSSYIKSFRKIAVSTKNVYEHYKNFELPPVR